MNVREISECLKKEREAVEANAIENKQHLDFFALCCYNGQGIKAHSERLYLHALLDQQLDSIGSLMSLSRKIQESLS